VLRPPPRRSAGNPQLPGATIFPPLPLLLLTLSSLFPTFASPQFRWRTNRTHKTIIRTLGTTTAVPRNNSNSTVTSSAKGMAGTRTLDPTTHTAMDRTIRTAATMLTTTINRTRPTTRGDTISTLELPRINTMRTEGRRVWKVNRLCRHRRRSRRCMSTMTWPKRDLEGESLARELPFMLIRYRLSADAFSLQEEKFQGLESRRPRESVDQGKPNQNLRTFLLLHDNDHRVSDHQCHPFSRVGTSSTECPSAVSCDLIATAHSGSSHRISPLETLPRMTPKRWVSYAIDLSWHLMCSFLVHPPRRSTFL